MAPRATGKEKIEAALSEAGAPEIPVVLPYEDLYIRDNWEQLTARPWWHRADPSIERQLEWRSEVRARIPHDWLFLPEFYSREERENMRIEARADGVFRIEDRTGEETKLDPPRLGGWSGSRGVESFAPQRLAETFKEIDELIPAPRRCGPEDIRWDGRDALAESILHGFGKDLYPISHVSSPLWSCYNVWGYEGMMSMVATQPSLVRHACERLLHLAIQAVQRAASLGAAAIWIEECLTDQIAPAAFQSLNAPSMNRLVAEIRACGLRSIYYFCGDPAGKWDHILSIGADAIALEEGKKGFAVDIDDVVDLVRGRCTLLGNLDAAGVLQDGTDEQLRAEVLRQITAGRRNNSRFIMSVGSPATPGTSPERLRSYCELARELGTA